MEMYAVHFTNRALDIWNILSYPIARSMFHVPPPKMNVTFMYISNIISILKIHFVFCIFQDLSHTNRKIYKKRIRSEADFCVILMHILYESYNLTKNQIKSLNLFSLNYTELGIGRDPINRKQCRRFHCINFGDFHSFKKIFLGNCSNSNSKPKYFILYFVEAFHRKLVVEIFNRCRAVLKLIPM